MQGFLVNLSTNFQTLSLMRSRESSHPSLDQTARVPGVF